MPLPVPHPRRRAARPDAPADGRVDAGRGRPAPLVADRAACARVEVSFERPAAALVRHGLSRHQQRRRAAGARLHHLGLVARQPCATARPSSTTPERSGDALSLAPAHATRRARRGVRRRRRPRGLPTTFWRVARGTRADRGTPRPSVTGRWRTRPSTPARLLDTHLLGEPVMAVHESLSLDRFDTAAGAADAAVPHAAPRTARRLRDH